MTRTYIITGAASGIGAKTAELLREQGHTVVGVDLQGVEVSADLSTPDGRAEVHLLSFADRTGYDAYLTDPERGAAGRLLDGVDVQRRLLEVDDVGLA